MISGELLQPAQKWPAVRHLKLALNCFSRTSISTVGLFRNAAQIRSTVIVVMAPIAAQSFYEGTHRER